ncbi:serine/threonine-protein kinase HipA [Cyclonatronum proteinivorum]|uniref:Serine/threonine-protein kinase HipA n=2 Tax=Cyclonatronum proteinivorum TaxID=1457365 RepID=A0A345UGS5_9BACT|nr:serine/threonine-protein kinase HipA [Cyclonatronum proteinivorum]
MPMTDIRSCPCTLKPGFDTFSPKALKKMFGGVKVSHMLPDNFPSRAALVQQSQKFTLRKISLSGVQPKFSVDRLGQEIVLTSGSASGKFMLKPAPFDLSHASDVPANEHLTMQIAGQVYGINTAENALVFFRNGEAAYLTKRFDYGKDDQKYPVEDFASLAGKTSETAGQDFKYSGSYEDAADLIYQFVPAAKIEIEKFFKLIVFNFLASNGDAHLKNFSIIGNLSGHYQLAPAYDLTNTSIHVSNPELALFDGLFKDNFETESFEANGFRAYDDFLTFGLRIGIQEKRVKRMLDFYRLDRPAVYQLIENSFLDNELKLQYAAHWKKRLKALNYSYMKHI